MVVAASAVRCHKQAQRREQLADNELGPLIKEIETGRRPEWRDISLLLLLRVSQHQLRKHRRL
jgi:hypothetical protein